jgi:transcriptional regulator with XRE-family HTH domain
MPMSNNNNWYGMTDQVVLVELGNLIKQMRLNSNITQEALARIAGLDRTTVSQLENGRAATLLTFVQVLRAMKKLELLDNFIEEKISPLQALKLKGKERIRASSKMEKE